MGTPIRESKDEQFLHRLEQLVKAHLEEEDFGVNELAGAAGYSRSQLHRKVKSLLGHSASVFIRRVRLTEALEMLKHDEATTSEIAYRVGFHSPSYFHRCFHRYYGMTPGAFKESYLSNPDMTLPNSEGIRVKPTGSSKNREVPKFLLRPATWIAVAAAVIIGLVIFRLSPLQEAALPGQPSIAVLPFSNMGNNENTRFFADGMMDDLLHRLSKVSDIRVISRTSSEVYRNRGDHSLSEIADELGVQYIVEGSVQRYDNQARINIKLIDASKDQTIWSRNYDRRITDLFAVQSEIALNIATEVHQLLTDVQAASLQGQQTENLKAFEMYSLGTFELKKRTGAGYVRALNYFQEAINEDPTYGKAYTGLAETYFLMGLENEIENERARNLAVSLAEKALESDPGLAEAKTLLAAIYGFMDKNWTLADRTFEESIRINPNLSQSYMYHANLKWILGDTLKARQQMNKALELDPLSYTVRYHSARLYFQNGQMDLALQESERCREILPEHGWSHWLSFKVHTLEHRQQEALRSFKTFGELSGEFHPVKADSAFAAAGTNGLLQLRIKRCQNIIEQAECYAMLSQDDKALNLLQTGLETGVLPPDLAGNYHFSAYKNRTDFRNILRDLQLPPSTLQP
ncbi:helix-turn-helix domain-containing protein [Robertkochia flava]|uniref:helix-turn-helix domain-containing protein n=1 Tax=Robertkochia flava TaxID=3447986 RepID=UPI001CCCFFAA|nr:FlgO family outer membrane protein [Robertkochia marina]